MLFGFHLPLSAPILLHEIFLVETNAAKVSMRAASIARDQFALLMSNMATAPIGSDFKALLDLVNAYLPMIVAIVEQVHRTANRRMSQRLVFKWSSWLAESRDLMEMTLLEDELCSIYCLAALLEYKQADCVLNTKYDILEPAAEIKKKAIAHLRRASSMFDWIGKTLVPLSLMASEHRPLECSVKSLEALSILCLCNWQELIIESAIAEKKTPGAIARLLLGVVDKYGAMQQAINGLGPSYHSLDPAFKVLPRIFSEYRSAQAYRYLGVEALDQNNYGSAIALFQKAKLIAEEIRFPEVNHPTIFTAKSERQQFVSSLHTQISNLIKDNSTIYFAVVPDVNSISLPAAVFMPKCDKYEPVTADPRHFFDL